MTGESRCGIAVSKETLKMSAKVFGETKPTYDQLMAKLTYLESIAKYTGPTPNHGGEWTMRIPIDKPITWGQALQEKI